MGTGITKTVHCLLILNVFASFTSNVLVKQNIPVFDLEFSVGFELL